MNQFEFAHPTTEAEAVEMLTESRQPTILGSGMDLVNLLRKAVLDTDRVVDLSGISTLHGLTRDSDGVTIGALTTLDEISQHPLLGDFPSLSDVVREIRAIQVQQTGTLGGDLCHLPNCWYFRSGYGLLGIDEGRSLPEIGDNRYHAIFGNTGPAKFVSASRFAPALIALGAQVRIAGPHPEQEQWIPLAEFFVTPKANHHGITVLRPGQFLTHLQIPDTEFRLNATYEVLEMQGLDWPLASAAVSLKMNHNLIEQAQVVLGHVAPVPWISRPAINSLIGQPVTRETAARAGEAAVREATPLSGNRYKIQLAKTSVARAILKATDQLEGGL